jgi:hypothetical protein
VAVQVDQAAQNLPGPPLQDLWVNMLMLLPVPVPQAHASEPERPRKCSQSAEESLWGDSLPQCARREELRDEIDRHGLAVQPGVVEGHDVLVLQLL